MKTLLIIQHEDSTTPGTTLLWAEARNIPVSFWWPREGAPAPRLDSLLGVVICGGTMDTFQEDAFPWLKVEKQFLDLIVKSQTKCFGICLGSQLLAEVLGGHVHQHRGWEIGFVPVSDPSGAGTESPLSVFQWHHYTFSLPPSAELLLTNDFCRNQAFKVSDHIIATQFHPESTEEWIRTSAKELRPDHAGSVQTEAQMLASLPEREKMQRWYFEQLDRLLLSQP